MMLLVCSMVSFNHRAYRLHELLVYQNDKFMMSNITGIMHCWVGLSIKKLYNKRKSLTEVNFECYLQSLPYFTFVEVKLICDWCVEFHRFSDYIMKTTSEAMSRKCECIIYVMQYTESFACGYNYTHKWFLNGTS